MHVRFISVLSLLVLPQTIVSQQIWDIWQTTWDREHLFSNISPSVPLNFTTPSAVGQADIDVDDTSTYQSVWGFGGTLTDSSALILSNLKSTNPTNYNTLLTYMFDGTDGANAAGLNYIRVTLAASDFSASAYSYDNDNGDTSFSNFNINDSPSYLFSVLQDIYAINDRIKIHVLPWSPPGWMKTSGTMLGGSLETSLLTTYATYLLKCLQGFQSHGLPLYAISIQNEVLNSDSTYPSSTLTYSEEAQIGNALRTLMDNNGFSYVKLIGYEHNWSNAGTYPIELMQTTDVFDGVSFHCYAGDVEDQTTFHTAYPQKEIYFTECSGTIGSDWWSDIKWYMDNLFVGAIEYNAHSALMWNIALDGNGDPKLPGTDSCGGAGCRAIVQVNSDGTYSVNQEFYSMAQASKAIIPKDVGGDFGKRIGVTVGGTLYWALRVGAYVTPRTSSSAWLRYSLVVLNWDDEPNGSWDPIPVQTTIEFRDMQATYTFPVGVTTLWWYAPPLTSVANKETSFEAYSKTDDGSQQRFQLQFT